MKKAFLISFTTLAALIALLLGIVPHHHHNGNESVACVMMEDCHQNNATDNEQPNPNTDDATHDEKQLAAHCRTAVFIYLCT